MPNAIPEEILKQAEKRVRETIEDFQLNHHLKPNAMMAGNDFISDVVGAVHLLVGTGQKATVEKYLTLCPITRQQTMAGLPFIVANRNDQTLSAVLVGTPEILIHATA